MKIITLYQPWASWIALGWKTIETREHKRFMHLVGETIGIHASQKWDKQWMNSLKYLTNEQLQITQNLEEEFRAQESKVRGVILCTILAYYWAPLKATHSQRALIDCGYTLRYGLFLKNPKFINPISCDGSQGIWYYDIPLQFRRLREAEDES